MGVIDLNKENFKKVRILASTFYENLDGDSEFVKAVPPKMEKDAKAPSGVKDVAKHNHLVVGEHLTIQTARKLVQSQKAAPIYAPGTKPKEK